MNWEQIKRNLANALRQLMALRVIITSPREKVADLPAPYVLLAALMDPWVCALLLVLGLITRHAIRFEQDAARM